jgi:predicted kinase
LASGIYTKAAGAATYRRLGELAREVVGAGYPVVVDATFLGRPERDAFRAIAEQFEAPFLILDFHSPLPVLRARIAERLARADDASEADFAVLEHQLAAREPLTPAEMAVAFAVDATVPVSHDIWRPAIERLRRSAAGTASHLPARVPHSDDETIT